MAERPGRDFDFSKGLDSIRAMFSSAESGEDQERIAGALLRSCLAILPADGASLLLRGRPLAKYYVTRSQYEKGTDTVGHEALSEPLGLSGRALEESQPLAVSLSGTDAGFDKTADGIPGLADPRLFLVAPLEIGSRASGCLALLFEHDAPDAALSLEWLTHLAATGCQALHQRSSFERLRKLSTTDDLTGAYNYRYLLDGLRREIRRAYRFSQVFSVVMLDVDHLKEYNDVHGHLAGSRLLASFAQIVRAQLRAVDTTAKYGGDEFVIILPQTSKEGAKVVAERIRAAIEVHHFPGEDRKITTSLGISSFPEDGDQVETLLAQADEALYRAKKSGRNRVCLVGEDEHVRETPENAPGSED